MCMHFRGPKRHANRLTMPYLGCCCMLLEDIACYWMFENSVIHWCMCWMLHQPSPIPLQCPSSPIIAHDFHIITHHCLSSAYHCSSPPIGTSPSSPIMPMPCTSYDHIIPYHHCSSLGHHIPHHCSSSHCTALLHRKVHVSWIGRTRRTQKRTVSASPPTGANTRGHLAMFLVHHSCLSSLPIDYSQLFQSMQKTGTTTGRILLVCLLMPTHLLPTLPN